MKQPLRLKKWWVQIEGGWGTCTRPEAPQGYCSWERAFVVEAENPADALDLAIKRIVNDSLSPESIRVIRLRLEEVV